MSRRLVTVVSLMILSTMSLAAVPWCTSGAAGAGTEARQARSDWVPVAAWEFSSEADLAYWQHRNPRPEDRRTCTDNNVEVEHSRTMNLSTDSVVNIVVNERGGFLKLGVRQKVCPNGRVLYRSGHVGTQGTFGHSTANRWRISARIKFPTSSGNHASLWTRGFGSPEHELDIAETFGVKAKCPLKTNFYLDYLDGTPGNKRVCLSGRPKVPAKPLGHWHYYRADVSPGNWARIYIDSRLVHTYDAAHTPAVDSFMILSNLVNDGSKKRGTYGKKRVQPLRPGATTMVVDWLRVSAG